MKFVIVGAGALGSIYAAYLARSEHQVSLIARGERAVALATHGISVEGKDSFSVHCDIVTQPETLKQADVVIVAVKTYDTDAALEPLRGLKADSVFSVHLAHSTDLIKWSHIRRLDRHASQATIRETPSGGYLLAFEKDAPNSCWIRIRFYKDLEHLRSGEWSE